MEVHHHSSSAPDSTHTPRKKWTHYFWEFLMLFLAVFCGFFAEYQLEHLIEKDREKQFMISLVKDLEQDTSNINIAMASNQRRLLRNDSLIEFLSSANYRNKMAWVYYLGRTGSIRTFFYSTNGTLEQLKNSGGLRLIKNRKLVDSILAYDNLSRVISDFQQTMDMELRDYREAAARIFDAKIFEEMIEMNGTIKLPVGNPDLINSDKLEVNNFLVKAHYTKLSKISIEKYLSMLSRKAYTLIKMINEEYSLK